MLIRIVRMTFAEDTVESFLTQFDKVAPQIRQFPGCRHLALWQDADVPTVCTTYSHWDSADALERYRGSGLFRDTWASVKPLFADRPEAHSYTLARSTDAIEQAMSAEASN